MPRQIVPNIRENADVNNITRIMTPSLRHDSEETLTVATQNDRPSEVYEVMRRDNIHHMPIVDGGNKLVEVITFTDFLRCMYPPREIELDSLRYQLDQEYPTIMDMLDIAHRETGHEPRRIKVTNTIHEAADILKNGNFHSLPVVTEDKTVVGIVTSTDLIEYLRTHYRRF